MKFLAVIDSGSSREIEVEDLGEGRFLVGGVEKRVDVTVPQAGVYSLIVDGRSYEVSVRDEKKGMLIEIGGHLIPVRLMDPSEKKGAEGVAEIEGEAVITSPMPGRIVGIRLQAGDAVEAGQGVIVVEAMKMENELHAPKGGKIKSIAVKVGDAVEAGQELVTIE